MIHLRLLPVIFLCAVVSESMCARTIDGKNVPGIENFDTDKLSIGAGLSFMNYGALKTQSPGIDLRGDYLFNETNALAAGFTYGLGSTFSSTTTALANNLSTSAMITIPVTYNFHFHELYLQYEHLFYIPDEEDHGFYAFGGIGLTLVPNGTQSYGPYDQANFTPQNKLSGNSASGAQAWFFRLGAGGQIKFGKLTVFAELKTDVTLNSSNPNDPQPPNFVIPMAVGIVAGIKYPLEQD